MCVTTMEVSVILILSAVLNIVILLALAEHLKDAKKDN